MSSSAPFAQPAPVFQGPGLHRPVTGLQIMAWAWVVQAAARLALHGVAFVVTGASAAHAPAGLEWLVVYVLAYPAVGAACIVLATLGAGVFADQPPHAPTYALARRALLALRVARWLCVVEFAIAVGLVVFLAQVGVLDARFRAMEEVEDYRVWVRAAFSLAALAGTFALALAARRTLGALVPARALAVAAALFAYLLVAPLWPALITPDNTALRYADLALTLASGAAAVASARWLGPHRTQVSPLEVNSPETPADWKPAMRGLGLLAVAPWLYLGVLALGGLLAYLQSPLNVTLFTGSMAGSFVLALWAMALFRAAGAPARAATGRPAAIALALLCGAVAVEASVFGRAMQLATMTGARDIARVMQFVNALAAAFGAGAAAASVFVVRALARARGVAQAPARAWTAAGLLGFAALVALAIPSLRAESAEVPVGALIAGLAGLASAAGAGVLLSAQARVASTNIREALPEDDDEYRPENV